MPVHNCGCCCECHSAVTVPDSAWAQHPCSWKMTASGFAGSGSEILNSTWLHFAQTYSDVGNITFRNAWVSKLSLASSLTSLLFYDGCGGVTGAGTPSNYFYLHIYNIADANARLFYRLHKSQWNHCGTNQLTLYSNTLCPTAPQTITLEAMGCRCQADPGGCCNRWRDQMPPEFDLTLVAADPTCALDGLTFRLARDDDFDCTYWSPVYTGGSNWVRWRYQGAIGGCTNSSLQLDCVGSSNINLPNAGGWNWSIALGGCCGQSGYLSRNDGGSSGMCYQEPSRCVFGQSNATLATSGTCSNYVITLPSIQFLSSQVLNQCCCPIYRAAGSLYSCPTQFELVNPGCTNAPSTLAVTSPQYNDFTCGPTNPAACVSFTVDIPAMPATSSLCTTSNLIVPGSYTLRCFGQHIWTQVSASPGTPAVFACLIDGFYYLTFECGFQPCYALSAVATLP